MLPVCLRVCALGRGAAVAVAAKGEGILLLPCTTGSAPWGVVGSCLGGVGMRLRPLVLLQLRVRVPGVAGVRGDVGAPPSTAVALAAPEVDGVAGDMLAVPEGFCAAALEGLSTLCPGSSFPGWAGLPPLETGGVR